MNGFRHVADEDVYICPAGERLAYQTAGAGIRRVRLGAGKKCQRAARRPAITAVAGIETTYHARLYRRLITLLWRARLRRPAPDLNLGDAEPPFERA
jgi:hypothetical protein